MSPPERAPEVTESEGAPAAAKSRDGCFYTLNLLMIIFGAIPVLILIILGLLWLFF